MKKKRRSNRIVVDDSPQETAAEPLFEAAELDMAINAFLRAKSGTCRSTPSIITETNCALFGTCWSGKASTPPPRALPKRSFAWKKAIMAHRSLGLVDVYEEVAVDSLKQAVYALKHRRIRGSFDYGILIQKIVAYHRARVAEGRGLAN